MKRNLVITATLIFVLILIPFTWKESINFNQKIDHQKIANFFVILFTFSGTIATLYYTYKQYKLSETQVKPEIYPLRRQIFEMIDINFTEDENEGPVNTITTINYSANENDTPFKEKQGGYFGNVFLIENIGYGIAKDIQYKWLYDKNEVEELINGIYYLTPNDKPNDIFYLKPNNQTSIYLPSEYFSCCGSKLFENYESSVFSNRDYMQLTSLINKTPSQFNVKMENEILKWQEENFPKIRPKISLELTYSDVQGNNYKNIFDIKVSGVAESVILECELNKL